MRVPYTLSPCAIERAADPGRISKSPAFRIQLLAVEVFVDVVRFLVARGSVAYAEACNKNGRTVSARCAATGERHSESQEATKNFHAAVTIRP